MGWKGTVRSIGAAVRAAERDAKRRQRELEKRQKQYERMQELEQAAYEVEVYENHIEIIQSLHKECSVPIQWKELSIQKEPIQPEKTDTYEHNARHKADNYKPGFIDRLFQREEKVRQKLKTNIEVAINQDTLKYNENFSKWKKDFEEWEKTTSLAKSLLNGHSQAKLEVIEDLDPFSEISNLGSSLEISIGDTGIVEATINVHGKEIIPNEIKGLLQSGKLSVKKMPQGKFNELYQDYVCSSILRVANELFSILPDDLVIITAVDELLNTQTGHLEESPILSACISRSTLQSLNLEAIDPSDSMTNFVHNMSFKKTKGFDIVSRVKPERFVNI
ncbi:hypothetical protein [Sulfurimonas sp.]|uniref:hypothetical protein n=1 Tax=Sulfurimonas sp. TaxID=2022749 RepID=UPI003D11BDD0